MTLVILKPSDSKGLQRKRIEIFRQKKLKLCVLDKIKTKYLRISRIFVCQRSLSENISGEIILVK